MSGALFARACTSSCLACVLALFTSPLLLRVVTAPAKEQLWLHMNSFVRPSARTSKSLSCERLTFRARSSSLNVSTLYHHPKRVRVTTRSQSASLGFERP